MKRKIIRIDNEKCNGCGDCIPNCPEGALQIVDGKARMVRDLLCDGLGACIGHCPQGAIAVEEREAEAYDERTVMAGIYSQGERAVEAHLKHLRDHNDEGSLRQALHFLRERGASVEAPRSPSGCPGTQPSSFLTQISTADSGGSRLTHWPIQLHLINPMAPHYRRSDLLLAADCVAYSAGDFHGAYLNGRTLAIGCPKLDDNQEVYLSKLTTLIDAAEVNSLTVMIMQVPCCSGLFNLARSAVVRASRKIPIKYVVVGIRGEILQQGTV